MKDTHHNGERFLKAFASIERSLNEMAGSTVYNSFSRLLSVCSSRNTVVRTNQERLREYAELRNAIVHQRDDEEELIAIPTDSAVSDIERIARLIDRKRSALYYATKPVKTVSIDDTVTDAYHAMKSLGTTKIPVYSEQSFKGIVTMETIAGWAIEGGREDILCSDILEHEKIERVVFLKSKSYIEDVINIYESAMKEGRRPPVIILTKNGSRNQRPEGIITAYDLPSILAALI